MIVELNNINMQINYTDTELINKCAKKLKTSINNIVKIHKLKESIDARKKDNVHYVLNLGIELKKYKNKSFREINVDYSGLKYEKTHTSERPIIIGFGPSGMFCALALSEMGLNPIVIEQGKDIENRQIDIQNFWNNRKLNQYCNVQNGEGGAGTFSDGKLNTNINSIYNRKVINEFILAGAPKEIYYQSKPHIGSDNLPTVVKNIREKIIKNGGTILFNEKLTNLSIKNGKIAKICTINTISNTNSTFDCKNLILAIGHSAIDTFELLQKNNLHLMPKPFAIGVRIEQNQKLINYSQYGESCKYLHSADYKLVAHLENGRSVFTFCMCPGGEVIASSCEKNTIVTNGMSNYARNLCNANSALLVNVTTNDVAKENVLDGLYYQRQYEKLAFELGGSNYNAPCQRVGDFILKNSGKFIEKLKNIKKILKNKAFCNKLQTKKILRNTYTYYFRTNVLPTYKPNITFANISKCLPKFVTQSLVIALRQLQQKLNHFADDDCLLTAIETRTSCPVQIKRDDNFESNISGIYPIGEGAGYAGGIMTSAIDGIKCAEAIYQNIKNKYNK